jgi:hypothetical protein
MTNRCQIVYNYQNIFGCEITTVNNEYKRTIVGNSTQTINYVFQFIHKLCGTAHHKKDQKIVYDSTNNSVFTCYLEYHRTRVIFAPEVSVPVLQLNLLPPLQHMI